MDIKNVIDYLNKQLKYDLDHTYYLNIDTWRKWWEGFYKPFHEFSELSVDKKKIPRQLYTLKMAKKVCEDWASILLNEKTQIVVSHRRSNLFLQGNNQTEGVFGENNFWVQANALIEKAFYSGTGVIIAKIDNMLVKGDKVIKNSKSKIRLEYLPAGNIIPLTVKSGKIIDVAFASEVLIKGQKFIYIETHILGENGYTITNSYFKDDEGKLTEQPLPQGIIGSYQTGTSLPLFAIITPGIVNNINENIGLGLSVFANAIDNLMGVDLAYNNFCKDFKLGGKKVFLSKSLVLRDSSGAQITPDDIAQQLFTQTGEGDLDDEKELIHEFNPELRVQDNKDGVQAQLDYLSFKCGLGTKHYQFNNGTIVTATQYTGDKQELIQNASKHYIIIEKALQDIVRAILWVGKTIIGEAVNPDAEITITFDDSYIIDKEAERTSDRQDMSAGVMPSWEYRKKWYGETEEQAKKMIVQQADVIT